MNLEKNYNLLEVVRDNGIRTFQASEIASGRELQIHLFIRSEDQALFERIRALPLSSRGVILEFGDELRIPYLITDPLPKEIDTRAWLMNLLAPAPRPQPIKGSVWKTGTPIPDPLFPPDPAEGKPPAKPVQNGGEGPGEFTRMFQAPAAPEPITAETPRAASTATSEIGDFTRMFQIAPPSPPAPSISAPPVNPATAPFDPEATRLFPVPAEPVPPPPLKSEPGEFTRFFQSPLNPLPQNSNAPPGTAFNAPPAIPAAHSNSPGEFTQMFGSPSGKQPAPVPSFGSGAPFSGSATGAFASPVLPPLGQSDSTLPGQFTRMMSASAAPTLGQNPMPPQTPAKGTGSKLPLILILGSLALFAILIVVFFALRH